jgi:hypothetical protein
MHPFCFPFIIASPCTFPSLLTTVSLSMANPHSWNKSAPFARSFIIVSKWLKSGWSTYGSSVRPCRPLGVSCLPRVMPFILVSGKSTSQRYKFGSPPNTSPFSYSIYSIFFFLCEVQPPCSQFFSLQATFGDGGGGGVDFYTTPVGFCIATWCIAAFWGFHVFTVLLCVIRQREGDLKNKDRVKVLKLDGTKRQVVKLTHEVKLNLG